jgi:hypothetical protein
MKNLLLILLLANILYFVWGMLTGETSRPGIAIVEESDLGPPIAVITGRDSEAVASVGAMLGSGGPSAMEAIVGRTCVTVGPFSNEEDADSAVMAYSSESMRTNLRSTTGKVFLGHWVQIRNIADAATASYMIEKLAAGGLTDAYAVQTEEDGLTISLGLFGSIERAERIELQAKSLNLPAEVSPGTRNGTVYFVDLELPPGKGAGAIVEKYGEDRVLLRAAATCP